MATVTATAPEAAPPRTASNAPGGRRFAPGRLLGATAIWVFVGFCLFAFAFMLLSSLKTSRDVLDHPWSLPLSPHWSNWSKAWHDGGFGPAFANSVVLVLCAAGTTVLLAAPAAYVLGRQRNRITNAVSVYFVVGLGIPMQIMVLPLYAVMAKLHLIDNLFGLYLLYVVVSLPFTAFLLTSFFGSLPGELEEAAALDGVSASMTFWRIMLPLARGGLATAFLLTAIGCWNETLLALMFIQTNGNYTLPLALVNFLQQQQFSGADFGALFAGVSMAVLPMLALYIWLGRRLTEGLTLGVGK